MNNPPAFPSGFEGWWLKEGMTLRDYFAAKAMQGIVAALNVHKDTVTREAIAGDAYELADAMLKAREQ